MNAEFVSFLAPQRLWLLVLVALFALAYILVQRRRKTYALRFASSQLFDSVAPSRPGFRRHVPAALFLLALATVVTAVARPTRPVDVPRERATVIVAIDVSLSMQADDVAPNRLEAAQAAASRFVEELPPTLNVGIVSFAGTATVLVPPTQDRLSAQNAISNLRLAESTAIGEAIFTSLDALINSPGSDEPDPPPARIVLLSDGETTIGRSDAQATAAALEADVPVSTIAFGTPFGSIVYDDPSTPQIETSRIPVAVQDANLEAIADATGGTFFSPDSLEELESVYADIGSAIGYETIDREFTDLAAAAAFVILLVASGLSLLWFQRLP